MNKMRTRTGGGRNDGNRPPRFSSSVHYRINIHFQIETCAKYRINIHPGIAITIIIDNLEQKEGNRFQNKATD